MKTRIQLALSVALGQLVTVLDTTIAVVAVPTLMHQFHAPLASVQWVTVGYVLALLASMPLSAWVASHVGGRRTYVAVMVAFALTSFWAGLASSLGMLIAARVAMGLAGGFVGPVGMALALDDVAADHRGRIGALLGLPVLVGPLLGPITAAWLVNSVSWRAIFWITVPPALAAAWLVRRFAPDGGSTSVAPLDVVGLALLVVGSVSLVLGVGDASLSGSIRPGLAVAGAGLIAAFVRRSWHRRRPVLAVRLLGQRTYRRSFTVAGLFAAAYFGSMLLSPTYVQVVRGDSAMVSGLVAVPAGLATGVSLQVCTRLIDRFPAHRIITAGLLVAGLALLAIATLARLDTPYVLWAVLSAVLGLGSGAVLMPSMMTATRELRGSDLGSGTAMLTIGNQLANALGNALCVAVYTAMTIVFVATPVGQVAALRLAYLVPLALIIIAIPVAWRLRDAEDRCPSQLREVAV